MPTTNTDFSTQITAIQSKAASLAASTSDAKDLVFLGKAIEALTVPNTVANIISEGDTQVANVAAQGVTSTNALTAAAATYSLHPAATVTAVNKTLVTNEFVMVTAAAKTMTLPAGAANLIVYISVGNFNNTVVAPNGSDRIMGLAESMTINKVNTTITLMYHTGTNIGWRAF